MRNKIELICTLGPRDLNEERIIEIAKTGMTILRLNASHILDNDLPGILETCNRTKVHSEYPFRIMLDLPGPEFRVFGFDEPLTLRIGDEINICTNGHIDPALKYVIYTNCTDFEPIKLTDAEIRFMSGELAGLPYEFSSHVIKVMITRGGILLPNSHINLTHSGEDYEFLSERDKKLCKMGYQYKVDQIALSMVRNSNDVFLLKMESLRLDGIKQPELVAKFETIDSLYDIREILTVSDACFVARGDLGVSIPVEAIPLVQRKILNIARELDRPVYIATQMLTSMMTNQTPTRAEVNDVATAILDGAAGITLSEETAIGNDILNVVSTAKRIIDTITLPDCSKMDYLEPENDLEHDIWKGLLTDYFWGSEMKSLLNIGSLIWQRGWAEANAGNVSYRFPPNCDFMTGLTLSAIGQGQTNIKDYDFTKYDWYLASATGSRYRDFPGKGFDSFVLVSQLRPTPENGYTYKEAPTYFFPQDRKPTSEWITHRAVHHWLIKQKSKDRVVLHTHSTDWITISSLPEYQADPDKLQRDIRACLPELDIYFPEGFALAPYATPGTKALSQVTLEALEKSSVVIWEKHGVFITAPTFDAAFDSLEIISKAAAVYLNLLITRGKL